MNLGGSREVDEVSARPKYRFLEVVRLPHDVAIAVLIRLIQLYRNVVSPWVGPSCRFHPSCSVYAIEAIRHFGLLRGTGRALARLFRCQPFSEGGYDPVR